MVHHHFIRIVHHPASFLSVWTVRRSARRSAESADRSVVSQLSTWIYVFIYTNRSGWTSGANCLNSILAEEKIKRDLLSVRTGSSQSLLCRLLMGDVYDPGLLSDPFFCWLFFFFLKFVNKNKHDLNGTFPFFSFTVVVVLLCSSHPALLSFTHKHTK